MSRTRHPLKPDNHDCHRLLVSSLPARLFGRRACLRKRLRRLLLQLQQEPYCLTISPQQQERLLLLQTELMTNCVKYAMPRATALSFSCWQIGYHWWLVMKGDGGYFDPRHATLVPAVRVPVRRGGYGLAFISQHLAGELNACASSPSHQWLSL